MSLEAAANQIFWVPKMLFISSSMPLLFLFILGVTVLLVSSFQHRQRCGKRRIVTIGLLFTQSQIGEFSRVG